MGFETFIADLHIHSRYSRATARNLDIENIYIWSQLKGIRVVGTGDFTHPQWFAQIEEKLEPAEPGLFRLKKEIARVCDHKVPASCRGPVRFLLSTEISNIYKKKDRTRKNHNLVFFPELEDVRRFNAKLDAIGNIHSDGRPILGLDARDLLEVMLEVSEQGFFVPAHIWTPWFSMLGSKSGFDSLEECFEDLSPHIFAAETGLSSDPAMNWRVEGLDHIILISNSDAHSPSKLGREANIFHTDLNYFSMREVLEKRDKKGFGGTIEFYPEEGKYHVDGHRKCEICFTPSETKAHFGNCPVCGKPLTLGVLHRVENLATRKDGYRPQCAFPFYRLIPLEDILSEILRVGPKSKKVQQTYRSLLIKLGSELPILHNLDQERIEKVGIPLLAEAIVRVRGSQVSFDPGYDGRYGKVRIFDDREREKLLGQQQLFISFDKKVNSQKRVTPSNKDDFQEQPPVDSPTPVKPPNREIRLNKEQQAAVDYNKGSLMIIAGPGTGKTRTLTQKILRLIESGVDGQQILALTFTNKAANEMKERLIGVLKIDKKLPFVGTFHALGYAMLSKANSTRLLTIIDEKTRKLLVSDALALSGVNKEKAQIKPEDLTDWIVAAKQNMCSEKDRLEDICPPSQLQNFTRCYGIYQNVLKIHGFVDFEDLIFQSIQLLQKDPAIRDCYGNRFGHLFIDEFQDINAGQYRLLKLLGGEHANITIIGDPDQSIYGFRGSDAACFSWFKQDYTDAHTLCLERNYRSTQTILAVSNQVIRNNPQSAETGLRRAVYSNVKGDRTIELMEAASAKAEAVLIGKTVEKMVGGTGFLSLDSGTVVDGGAGENFSFADFAVLYRTRGQAETIYRTLEKAGISCQQVDRKTITDDPGIQSILSTLKLMYGVGTFDDMLKCKPIIHPSPSPESIEILKAWAFQSRFSAEEAIIQVRRLPVPQMGRARQQRVYDFAAKLADYRNQTRKLSIAEKIARIAAKGGWREKKKENESFEKGYRRLQAIAQAYGTEFGSFLASVNLASHTDMYDHKVEKVAMMTMHAAKGLEFPVVFISGCENQWIPYRSTKQPSDLQEERRLFYVAMTRAKNHLFLTKANRRRVNGQMQARKWSPFVKEIENHYKFFSGQTRDKKTAPEQQQLSLF
jgi:uncharacterized protein (TIGR00375 family)